MKPLYHLRAIVFFLFSALCLSSCSTHLAPSYDAQLFKNLQESNIQLMILFANVSGGTQAATYPQREAHYNALIGSLDALALQSKARPVPESEINQKINQILAERGIALTDNGVPPSATALEMISKQVAKMKQVDLKSGLSPTLVVTFRNAVIISMDQALTYESFLNR